MRGTWYMPISFKIGHRNTRHYVWQCSAFLLTYRVFKKKFDIFNSTAKSFSKLFLEHPVTGVRPLGPSHTLMCICTYIIIIIIFSLLSFIITPVISLFCLSQNVDLLLVSGVTDPGPPSHSNRPIEKGSIGTKHDISGKLTLRLFFDPLEGS